MKTIALEQAVRDKKLPQRPIGRETVQDRVYRQLKDMILDGEIEPGRTITIQSLADAFEVSAMPVREALRRLITEQALTVISGRSVGIPPLTPARLEDLRRVRREIEGAATAWAVGRIKPDALAQLAALVEVMESAAKTADGGRYVPANHHFHFGIYNQSGSPTVLNIIESLWLQISPYFHVLRTSENWYSANSAHRAVLNALTRGDGEAAAIAIRRDIDEAAETLMKLLTGVNEGRRPNGNQ